MAGSGNITLMINLKSSDLQTLYTVGEAAFHARSMPELCTDTLRLMESAVNASSSVYFDISETCDGLQFRERASRGVPDQAPGLWCQQYQPQDPFVLTMVKQAKGGNLEALASHELVERNEYINSEFYNIFLKPQSIYHVLVVGLIRHHKLVGLMGFHRPLGTAPFSKRDITLATQSAPQIAIAMDAITTADTCKEGDRLINTLIDDIPYEGIAVLDAGLDVIYISEVASALFHSQPEISHKIRSLCQQMLRNINSPKEVRVPLSKMSSCQYLLGNEMELTIRQINHGQNSIRFMLYFGDQSGNVILKKRIAYFGLTKREAEIVRLVSVGMTNPEVAYELGISIRTVQNHLRSIYEKVGVHNRTSLFYQLAIKG